MGVPTLMNSNSSNGTVPNCGALPCLPQSSSGLTLEKKYSILRHTHTQKQPNKQQKKPQRKQETKLPAYFSISVREKSQENINSCRFLSLPKRQDDGTCTWTIFAQLEMKYRAKASTPPSDVPQQPTTHLLLHKIPLVSQAGNNFYTSQIKM